MIKLPNAAKAIAFVSALGPWGWAALGSATVGLVVFLALVLVIEPRHNAITKAQARVDTVTTAASTTATQAVVGLVEKQADKTEKVHKQQEQNAAAIDKSSSAGTSIPDADADAWRRGLCSYDSTSGDSACS